MALRLSLQQEQQHCITVRNTNRRRVVLSRDRENAWCERMAIRVTIRKQSRTQIGDAEDVDTSATTRQTHPIGEQDMAQRHVTERQLTLRHPLYRQDDLKLQRHQPLDNKEQCRRQE